MSTVFNDKIFADLAFQQVVNLLAPLRAFTTDISSAAKAKGDTIVCQLFDSVTATTFTQATDVFEQTGGTVSAVTLSLDKRIITPVDLTTAQLMESTGANKMDAFAYQMASATATRILQDVFSVFTVSSFGAPVTTASASFKLDALVALRAALTSKLCPKAGRSLIIDDGVEAGLLGDTSFTQAQLRGSDRTLNEGELGRIMGFDIYTTTALPSNSISLIGIACGKSGAAVAFRNIADVLPADEYAAVETVTDNESGLSMTYTRHWSRAQGKWFMNFHGLYGFVKAVTTQVHLVCTATT